MNWRLGIRRTIIAIFGGWSAFWLTYGGFNAYRQSFFANELLNGPAEMATINNQISQEAASHVGASLLWGIGGLVVGSLLVTAGLWIWNGLNKRPRV